MIYLDDNDKENIKKNKRNKCSKLLSGGIGKKKEKR